MTPEQVRRLMGPAKPEAHEIMWVSEDYMETVASLHGAASAIRCSDAELREGYERLRAWTAVQEAQGRTFKRLYDAQSFQTIYFAFDREAP